MLKALGIALLGTSFAAVALHLLRPPQDLQVIDARVIRQSDVPNSDEPGGAPEPAKLLAVVRFRSNTDLAKLAYSAVYQGLYVHSSLCRSHKKISEGYNLVFNGSGRISFGQTHGPREQEYHVYVALRSSDISGFSNYDLVKRPEDVCLELIPESTEFGEGPSSNIMRIARASLVNALAHAPHPR